MKQLFAASGCVQVPVVHTSFVHATLSLVHADPSDLFVVVQPPVPSHVADAWQSLAAQVYAVPPHCPAVHTSLFVHALPSLHAVPFVALLHAVALVAG